MKKRNDKYRNRPAIQLEPDRREHQRTELNFPQITFIFIDLPKVASFNMKADKRLQQLLYYKTIIGFRFI